MINFYAIKCINKTCNYDRFIAEDADGLPYLTYDSLPTYPQDIKQFRLVATASNYLQSVLRRESIDISKVSPAQYIELVRINNNDSYHIIKCCIDDEGKFNYEKVESLNLL